MWAVSATWAAVCAVLNKFISKTSVSLIHSVVMSSAYLTYQMPDQITSVINCGIENFWTEVMIGYLIYDLVCNNNGVDFIIHHGCGILTLSPVRYFNVGGKYVMWVFAAEISTIFLNMVKLAATTRKKEISKILFILSFFFCRVVYMPMYLASLIKNRNLWVNHEHVHSLTVVNSAVFVALNYFWFYKIAKRYVNNDLTKQVEV